jgi:hypothetical protein
MNIPNLRLCHCRTVSVLGRALDVWAREGSAHKIAATASEIDRSIHIDYVRDDMPNPSLTLLAPYAVPSRSRLGPGFRSVSAFCETNYGGKGRRWGIPEVIEGGGRVGVVFLVLRFLLSDGVLVDDGGKPL